MLKELSGTLSKPFHGKIEIIWSLFASNHKVNIIYRSKVDIRLILLENEHLGELNPVLENFMLEQGYEVKQRLNNQDIIFVKKLES